MCSLPIANAVDLVRSTFTEDGIRWFSRQKAALLLEGTREAHHVDAATLEIFRLQLMINRLETDYRIHVAGQHLENGIIDAVVPHGVNQLERRELIGMVMLISFRETMLT